MASASSLYTSSSGVSSKQDKVYAAQAWKNIQERDASRGRNIDLDREGEEHGYVLDAWNLRRSLGLPDGAAIKTTHDGETVLIPQPSDDPQDPLNWPLRKKNLILFIVCLVSFTADFGSAIGAITLLPQTMEWRLSPDTINHSVAGNVFMLGAGGLFVVAFSAYFGRLPVLLFFHSLSLGMTAWCAAATSFESFMTARILQGFFSVAGAAGGLMQIKDMYYYHQHPRAINIWSFAVILSPFLGPFCGAWIITKYSWNWCFWTLAIIDAVCWIMIVFCMDETFYRRDALPHLASQRSSRFLRLVGIEQWRKSLIGNSLGQAVSRPLIAISKLPVLLITVYYFFTFAWVIGINTTISIFIIPMYRWGPKQLALEFLAPIVSTIIGQAVGHWLHDFIGKMYARRHNGRIDPEARLIVNLIALPIIIAGMVVMGYCLQYRWHYMTLAIGWALHNFGIMLVTVGINAYLLDAYPEGAGEVSAWINFGRTTGGFVVGYFQLKWAATMGTKNQFGIEASIVAAASVIIVILLAFGQKLRHAQGSMQFATN
ncbi:MAG: hypothetical protein Q9227_006153 [Pyrenula ochraceoflavens]